MRFAKAELLVETVCRQLPVCRVQHHSLESERARARQESPGDRFADTVALEALVWLVNSDALRLADLGCNGADCPDCDDFATHLSNEELTVSQVSRLDVAQVVVPRTFAGVSSELFESCYV